jgi:hypothetical protein
MFELIEQLRPDSSWATAKHLWGWTLQGVGRVLTIAGVIFVIPALLKVGVLLALIGLIACILGLKLELLGRRYARHTEWVLEGALQDPVIYLRPFNSDLQTTHFSESDTLSETVFVGLFGAPSLFANLSNLPRMLAALPRLLLAVPRTEEEQLSYVLTRIGPTVAVARPGETRPPVGFPRLRLDPTTWQEQVTKLLRRARLVVLRCGSARDFEDGYWPTDHSDAIPGGLGWEIATVVKEVRPEKLVLLSPFDAPEYEEFCNKTKNIFPKPLPAWVDSNPQIGTIRSLIWFDQNWNSKITPVTWIDTGWRLDTLHPLAKTLGDKLRVILRTQPKGAERVLFPIKRAFATVVDYLLVFALFDVVLFTILSLPNKMSSFLTFVMTLFGGLIVYEAILESSALTATFGKCLFGLVVTDEANARLGLKKALQRSVVKFILLPVGWASFLTGSGRALHDLLTKTQVTNQSLRESEPGRLPFAIGAWLLWVPVWLICFGLLLKPIRSLPYGDLIVPGPLSYPNEVSSVTLNATVVDGLLIIPASIEGQRLSFLLGTRAGVTMVDKKTEQSLHLRPLLGKFSVSDGINTRAADFRASTTIELGGAELVVDKILVSDLTRLSELVQTKLDGVIGYDLLRVAVVVIDYPTGRVTIKMPDIDAPVAGKYTIPLSLSNGWASVGATTRIRGCEYSSSNYWIDTGLQAAILYPGCDNPTGTSGNESHTFDARTSQLSSIEFAGVRVDDLEPSSCIRTTLGPRIGAGFLKRFIVTIDYPHSRMLLDAPH